MKSRAHRSQVATRSEAPHRLQIFHLASPETRFRLTRVTVKEFRMAESLSLPVQPREQSHFYRGQIQGTTDAGSGIPLIPRYD